MNLNEATQLLKKNGYRLINEEVAGLSIEDYRDIVKDWLIRSGNGKVDKEKSEELAMAYGEDIVVAYDSGLTCQEEAEDILASEGIL